ncbi:MFS transporter [Arthrobacter sp. JSM 101049]|uniref:MFS transporter n=1 Tax=Arthrobacter sp. JSM 101049 TaxID=929097 RepID=UPI0035613E2B
MSTPSRAPETLTIPREIKVLIAAAFVIALGFGLIAPILPQFAKSFDVGVAAAGFIVSVFALTRLAFAPVSGRLTSALSEPPVYVGGVLIVAVSTILCGFAQDYTQLLVFRAAGGLGSTMFTVSAMSLIARLAPPEIRGRISGYYAGSFLIGNIVGPVVGGFLAVFGYRLPFFIYGGALIVAAAIVYLSLLGVRSSAKRGPRDSRPAMLFTEALRSRVYRAALVSGFANGWSNFGVRVALVPLFAAQAFDDGAALAGLSLGLFAIGNAVALTVAGRVTDRHGRRMPVLVGLTIGSLALAGIGLADHEVLFIALSIIAGAGIGFMNPAQQAAVADVIGRDHNGGKVMAGFQMATDSGAILGPVVAGLIADSWGFGWAFGITGVVGLVGAAAWWTVPRTLPEHR